jgi:branched-chain amino acid transport system ATP-binding protein
METHRLHNRGTTAAAQPLLQVSGVVAGYGRGRVLHGVDLDIAPGETVGLLGRNGSGRSTLLKAIMRLVRGEGHIVMDGREIGHAMTHEVSRSGIGYVPEDRGIFADLTVRENLSVGIPPHARTDATCGPAWSEEEFFEMFPNLKRRANVAGGSLSGGEQQMLAICRALVGRPRLILVDEPTEGLSLAMVRQIAELLAAAARRGIAILLVEQKLTIALDLCDRVAVMGHGRVVFDGTLSAFHAHPTIRSDWLEV